jgi:TusE/DsrC/DsvC family sulfur relay protein
VRALPDKISQITLASGQVSVDAHGYLTNPDLWSLEFARHVADNEGITLGPLHFEVISFMRRYLDEHGIMADARFVLKFLAERDNLDKLAAKAVMFDLFPYGYVKQACKIAGMKQPRAWSTG